MENILNLKAEILEQINATQDLKSLDEIRVSVMGKKGKLTELMKGLGSLPLEEKIALGKSLNVVKSEIDKAIETQKSALETKALDEKLKTETIDVTLPVRPEVQGRIHPVSKIYEEVVAIFGQMGFEVPMVRILKISSTILMRLICRQTIRRVKCKTRFTLITILISRLIWIVLMWCALILPVCKSEQWKNNNRQSEL